MTLLGNTFYGTTLVEGGANGQGTVFSVPMAGGSPTTLVTFNNTNGADPNAVLILSGSTLYGTTYAGGTFGDGTVFSLRYNHASLSIGGAPLNFGSNVGTLKLTGGNGSYSVASASFTATPTGYLAITGFNPSTDSEVYALEITDSVPGNLAADLADAVSEMNNGTYTGLNLSASTTDPTGGDFGNGYDFYITLTNINGIAVFAGRGGLAFGFDFTGLSGTTDTLSVSGVAVTGVPEPTTLGLLAIGSLGLLNRRRTKRISNIGGACFIALVGSSRLVGS